jgi:hypothetical protein
VAYINVIKEGPEMVLQYGLHASIMSNSRKTLVRKLEGQNHVGDLAVCGRRIITQIIKKQCFKVSDRIQLCRHRI